MQGGGPVAETTQRAWKPRSVLVARVGLILLWVLWAALAWWTAPRAVDAAQADADITAERVVSVERAETWDRNEGFWFTRSSPMLRSDGALVVWTTTAGQIRYTAPQFPGDPADLYGFGGQGHSPETDRLAAALAASDWRGLAVSNSGLAMVALAAGILLTLATLAIIILGPAPVGGTRFYWFWVALLPYGLGVLFWLGTERPWSNRAGPAKPTNGLTGFATLLLGSWALFALTIVLRELLGPSVIPG